MTKIDISEWKPFAIGNIFDVIKGTRLTKAHLFASSTVSRNFNTSAAILGSKFFISTLK